MSKDEPTYKSNIEPYNLNHYFSRHHSGVGRYIRLSNAAGLPAADQ
jgi:hypothetical protein